LKTSGRPWGTRARFDPSRWMTRNEGRTAVRPFGFFEKGQFMAKTQVLELSAERGRWGLLVLGLVANVCMGAVYAFSALWLNYGGWLTIAPAATATLFGSRPPLRKGT